MPGGRKQNAARPASRRLRCANCGGPLRPTHRFCPSCGTAVAAQVLVETTAAQPDRGVTASPAIASGPSLQIADPSSVDLSENRRLVSVLFADLSGSTSLGERLDPEDLRHILSSYFAALSRQI